MNQAELIDAIKAQTGFSKADIKLVLDAKATVAKNNLGVDGAEMPLPGLGKLEVVAKPERIARKPITGEEITVPAHNVVKFRAGKELKDAVA